MSELLTVTEAAKRIGASPSLIQKRCRDGSLPAIRVGKHYRVALSDLEELVRHTPRSIAASRVTQVSIDDLLVLVDSWKSYLKHVKAHSPDTQRTYISHFYAYIKRLSTVGDQRLTVERLYDRSSLASVYGMLAPKSFALKMNIYNSLRSFGSHMVDEGRLTREQVDNLKVLKPRQQVEPRRTHLKYDDVSRLFDVILTRPYPMSDNIAFAAVVGCMVYAGLRVSEVCDLSVGDIDLEARTLLVRCGKGGKTRKVGISQALYGYLNRYVITRKAGPTFFTHDDGRPWKRLKLARRMNTVSKRLGVDITRHGLRRTFATLAAAQGRSVNYLRIALGHANLETTQAYLRTSEEEVVAAMKDW